MTHLPVAGRPLLADTQEELDSYPRRDLLLASDVLPLFGLLTADGRYFYVRKNTGAESYLYDLQADPNGEHNILTPELQAEMDARVIAQLRTVADFYGYTPPAGKLFSAKR